MRIDCNGGESEMRSFVFSLRMFLSEDKRYLELMDVLENLDEELEESIVEKLKETNGVRDGVEGFPDIEDMNVQLYQILCDSAIPKTPAHNKIMALERREAVRGLYAYWDFTRELSGVNETSKQALAERVRLPEKAVDLDDLDIRLIQWEEDLKRHEK